MNYSQALSTEQLERQVPSAFAVAPYVKQSSRYSFIPTARIIEGMRSAGMVPVMAGESRTRIEQKRGFTKHLIRFRPVGALSTQAVVGDSIVEAVLINSHDGSSAYKLMAGVFRFVCSNGMVVADSMLETINVRHTGDIIGEVIEGSSRILESAPRVMDTIETWRGMELSRREQHVLAESAHSLRFPVDAEGKQTTEIEPEHLLTARRREDLNPDLWSTFNRIQENATKGVKTWANRHRVSARAIKSIDGNVNLNRALWTLAERFAELKRTEITHNLA